MWQPPLCQLCPIKLQVPSPTQRQLSELLARSSSRNLLVLMRDRPDPGEPSGCSTNTIVIDQLISSSLIHFLPRLYSAATPKRWEIPLGLLVKLHWEGSAHSLRRRLVFLMRTHKISQCICFILECFDNISKTGLHCFRRETSKTNLWNSCYVLN